MLDPSRTVASIVLDHSECARIFQQHRIDFCCRGDRTVEAAARERDLDVSHLVNQLEAAIAGRRDEGTAPSRDWSTSRLLDHIERTHHHYLREALPFARGLAEKVARVHGQQNPKLLALEEAVTKLAETLLAHIEDEEQGLFATLRREGGDAPEAAAALAVMRDEHLAVAQLLQRVRDASEEFSLPEWACRSYRALFGELEALEADTFRHVHLENHLLAPRVVSGTPEAQVSDESGERAIVVDLHAEAAALTKTPAYAENGHTAKTLLKKADARVVMLAIAAGGHILRHRTEHTISIQILTGHVTMTLPDRTVVLPAGAMLFLAAGIPHDVRAETASTVLLTIGWGTPRAPR